MGSLKRGEGEREKKQPSLGQIRFQRKAISLSRRLLFPLSPNKAGVNTGGTTKRHSNVAAGVQGESGGGGGKELRELVKIRGGPGKRIEKKGKKARRLRGIWSELLR